MFREWNKLSSRLKNSLDYEDFVLNYNLSIPQIHNYYSHQTYIDKIYLSFRMKNSLLQSDKYKMGLSDSINVSTVQHINKKLCFIIFLFAQNILIWE